MKSPLLLNAHEALRLFVCHSECLKLDKVAPALIFGNPEIHPMQKPTITTLHDVISAARLNPLT